MGHDPATRQLLLDAAGMVVGLLVKGAYEALENMTRGRHLSAAELQQAASSVGRPLTLLPHEVWERVEEVPVPDTEPASYDLVVPLWTGTAPAGLGVDLRLVPTPWHTFAVEITGFRSVDVGPGPWGPPARPQPTARAAAPNEPAAPPEGEPVPAPWRPLLEAIVHRLVIGDYAGLARDGFVSYTDDPHDASIGLWVEEYPATLVDLPPEAWTYSNHGPIDEEAGMWWVIVDLWTAEEGRSDLSMEATIWDDGTDLTVQVRTVHVM